MPTVCRVNDEDRPTVFAETFNDARMWFNHVLKVRNTNLINIRYFWRFITRGAMMISCAENDQIFDDEVSDPLVPLLRSMGPFLIGMFDDGDAP
jgi:hypothetical protein